MKIKSKIYFSDDQKKIKVTAAMKKLIEKAVFAALDYEHFDKPAEVSVTFTDNEGIREINREYRAKDAPTDVLSFPILSDEDPEGDINYCGGRTVIGDIVISVEKARDQAIEYGHGFDRELAFLSVHSTLHLLGYDHERSDEEDALMRKKQDEILNNIGLTR